MSQSWEEYYKKQLPLPEIGVAGQEKLGKARVAIVGVGGLGSIVAIILARTGVGYIKLIDNDIVTFDNLHRQLLYDVNDIGKPKVSVAKEKLSIMNPYVKIEVFNTQITEQNVDKLLANVNVIIDGLDNMTTRYIVNKYAVRAKIPYIFAGIMGLEGNISTFNPPKTPCLECIFGGLKDEELPKLEKVGVLPHTPVLVGLIEALEAIKLILGFGETLEGKLLSIDLLDLTFEKIEINKNKRCPVCSKYT